MCALKLVIISVSLSLILSTSVNCETICERLPQVQIEVFDDVNGNAKNITTEGVITHTEDVFQLMVANQTLRKLCENYVVLTNDVTVIQLLNNSIEDIKPSAFNIAATLALLKISENPLTVVRTGVFNQVKTKELDLSNNNIANIELGALDNNSHLEIITLNNNYIKEFDPNWFIKTPNIYKISVIYNEIIEIPEGAFDKMSKQRPLKIRLSANRIREIHPKAFDGIGEIEMLNLNGNKLQELPNELFINTTIKSLEVNTNLLTCFPDAFYDSGINVLEFGENLSFNCTCLLRIKEYVETNNVNVLYPSIICSDRAREVDIVFSGNTTYEISLMASGLAPPSALALKAEKPISTVSTIITT